MFAVPLPEKSKNPLLASPFAGNILSRNERVSKVADWIHSEDAVPQSDFTKKTRGARNIGVPKHHIVKYATTMDKTKKETGTKRFQGRKRPERAVVVRVSSIIPKDDWKCISEINQSTLEAVSHSVGEPVDIAFTGKARFFDKSVEKATTKNPSVFVVPHSQSLVQSVTISKDPFIQSLVKQQSETGHVRIFTSDAVLATLMASTRSIYSWDIVVTKRDGCIFLDKRVDSGIELLTVNENSIDPPAEADQKDSKEPVINNVTNLTAECTSVDQAYADFATSKDECLVYSNEPKMLYRYRKWSLGDNTELVVRTCIDTAVVAASSSGSGSSNQLPKAENSSHPLDQTVLANIHTCFEYDPKHTTDYRQKLDSQRGAIVGLEIKNNAFKLQKWSIRSILSGVDLVKLGFVSRTNFKERGSKYVLLGTESWKTMEFYRKLGYSIENAWGIVKAFSDLVQSQQDGKFVLVRDPNKLLLRFWAVNEEFVL